LKSIGRRCRPSPADSTPTARDRIAAQVLALHHLLERQHYKLGMGLAIQRHQLSALLRRQYAGRIACRDPAHSTPFHRLVQKADRGNGLPGLCGSTTSTAADPRNIFSAAPPDSGKRREKTPGVYMVIEKILGEHEKLHALAACTAHRL